LEGLSPIFVPSKHWLRSKLRTSLLFVTFLSLTLCPASFAQGVHVTLRANADPNPAYQSYAGVWGDGHYAYVGSERRNGVLIFDVSNPDKPVLAGSYAPSDSFDMEDIKVANGIGYFADNFGSGLHIVDLSDPANPIFLSRINAANGGFDKTHKVAVWQNFVFIPQNLAAPAIIKVFDVSDPSSPVLKTTFTSTDSMWVNDLDIQTTPSGSVRLYTAGWGGKGNIWDITNIATQSPTLLGSFSAGIDGSSASATDDGNFLAYSRKTIDGTSEVKIWNVSNPASPTIASTITMSAFGIDAVAPHDPKIMGNLLYVSWFQAGMLVFDISDPTDPLLVGSYDTWPLAPAPGQLDGNWGVYPYLGQDRVLLSDRNTGLYVVDATNVSSQPDLYNLHLNPTTVLGGDSATGTVYLVGMAGTGGTVITTSSDNPAAITPASVTVPANSTQASFTITTTLVNSTTTANIAAALNAITDTAKLTITTVPDFLLDVSPASLTIFPNQTGTFAGVLTAVGGFNHSVTLSCAPSAPPTCKFTPATVTPTPAGASFTLSVASSATTSYSFNVQGTGNGVTHQAPVTVSVSDFTISAPSPSSLNITPGGTSQFTTQIGAAGMFNAAVDLSCNAPAAGVTCSFSPSASVNPTSGNPVTVTAMVAASSTTPPGQYSLTVSSNSFGAPAPKTQSIALAVMDFSVSAANAPQIVKAGQTASYALSIAPVGGMFTNPVELACSGAPKLSTCSVTPSSVTPGTNGASFTVAVVTTAPSAALKSNSSTLLYAACLPFFAMILPACRRKHASRIAMLCFVLALLPGCGGGGGSTSPIQKPGTPVGTYTLTISADSGTLHHPSTLTLTVQ
jgi:hypothetical protein